MTSPKEYFDLPLDTLRSLAGWAADCADRALPVYAQYDPADPRPSDAIDAARAFAAGSARTNALRAAAMQAHRASTHTGNPAASAAARAASLAAASAYTHPFIDLKQAVHILGPAAYAALALELHGVGAPSIGDDFVRQVVSSAPPEVRWLLQKMPARSRGKTRLDHLLHSLDQGLRASVSIFQLNDPSFAICTLVPADEPELQQLCEACADYNLIVEGEPVSPSAAHEIFNETPPGRSLDGKFIFGLRNRSGGLVGVLEGMRLYPDDTTWWIGLLMLSPVIRGRGLGCKVVDAFLAHARSHPGITSVQLGVVEDNAAGLRFWQSVGFAMIRETEPRVFGSKTQKVLVLRREL